MIFISYAREDRDYIDQLFSRLRQHSVDAWYDRELKIGDDWTEVIEAKLKESQAILVILSTASIRAVGVKREVQKAQSLKKRILPILIGDLKESQVPIWIIDKQYADARNNKDPIPQILNAFTNTNATPSDTFTSQRRHAPPGILSDLNSSLIVVPNGGQLSYNRVGVNVRQIGYNKVGIITSFPDDLDFVRSVQLPVRLIPLDIVPENTVVISQGLQNELGLNSVSTDTWQLEFQGFQLTPIQTLNLELTIEIPLENAVRELERSQNLADRLIWAGEKINQADYEGTLLEISDRPYRVAKLTPLPTNAKVILEVSSSTDLNVFSTSAKSGVDMVILADCSGSMSITDLTDTSDQIPQKGWSLWSNKSQQKTLTRIKALQRALTQLLEMRRRISGRMSRIALVGFTHESNVRFPRRGIGMSEIDGSSPSEIINDFSDAIGLLRAEEAGTNIGQALHFAAELLHKHGHPGNERLIVLISDGAEWKPKGSDATGEVLSGLEDSVSLMAHLHETMDIHLHAIGISNITLFDKWMRANHPGKQAHESMIPNHDLLHQLVAVGGNDPSRTGDTEVLEEYFSGLGQGVTRKVKCPSLGKMPSLQAREKEIILTSTKRMRSEQIISQIRAEKDQLVQAIYESYISINEHSIAITGEALLIPSSGIQSISLQLGKDVIDANACGEFVKHLLSLIFDAVPRKSNNYEIPEALRLITSSIIAQDARNLDKKFKEYYSSTRQLDTPTHLGPFKTQLLGNFTIEYDDIEALNNIQLYLLKETAKLLQQVQNLLFDTLVQTEQTTFDDATIETDEPQFRFIG
jgi:hypothetical protein